MHSDETRQKISAALKGRAFSASHREALSLCKRGRRASPKTLAAFREHLSNSHHRRYEWILISPDNCLIRTQSLRQFCADHFLSYSAFRAAHQSGSGLPIKRGRSAGWIVFAVKILKSQDSVTI